MSGRLSFAARVGSYDDFTDFFGSEAREKFLYADLLGADTVKRGQYALEYMIAAFESTGLLNGQEVRRGFHDADFPDISRRVATNGANRLVGEMKTD